MKKQLLAVTYLVLFCCSATTQPKRTVIPDPAQAPRVPPEHSVFHQQGLLAIDGFVEDIIREGAIPGAVVVVGDRDGIVKAQAYGHRRLGKKRRMTLDTVFELASVTKPVAGASAALKAAELGKLSLGDTVAKHLPKFQHHRSMTLHDLASHRSGLPPGIDVRPLLRSNRPAPERIISRIARTRLGHAPREDVTYSDLGFIVLARAVEEASATDLSAFLQRHVFRPLEMVDTTFRPSEVQSARRAAVYPVGSPLEGKTHNRIVRAYLTADRVPGHAGLFSTAIDLANYCDMLLHGGSFKGRRLFAEKSVALMFSEVADSGMTVGWTIWPAPDGSPAIGKIGWLGTFVWVHRSAGIFVIYLTNRTHLKDNGDVFAPDYDGLLETVWRAGRSPK